MVTKLKITKLMTKMLFILIILLFVFLNSTKTELIFNEEFDGNIEEKWEFLGEDLKCLCMLELIILLLVN